MAFHRLLFDDAADALFLETEDERILDANPCACRLTGYGREELLAMRTRDLESPEARDSGRRLIYAELPTGESVALRSEVVRRDGRRVPVEVTLVPGLAGGERLYLSRVREAVESAGAGGAELEALFESIADAVIVIDREHRILRANPAARQWLAARGATEPVGTKCHESFHGLPTRCPDCPAVQAMRTGGAVRVEKPGDGDKRCLAVTASPLRGPGGEVVGAVEVIQDVSARAEAMRRMGRERERLEEAVAERTAALTSAQSEMVRRERLAALGQVSGSIAHELRNPLGTIRNATYMLNVLIGRSLDEQVARQLRVINAEIDRSNRIISSLLDFARGRTCTPAPCVVRELVDDVLEMADVPACVKVRVSIPEDLPAVLADDGQMVQVFLNLVTNACQMLGDGGTVTISAEVSGEMVRVGFADDGPGIEPETMERLFEPLFSTRSFGVGLGLVICRGFVEACGGRLDVQSAPGAGTTFTVCLPVADRPGPTV